MVFWGLVGVGYLAVLGVGHLVGRYLAGRRRGDGHGGNDLPAPAPDHGPSLALDCPPLGSAFDRALLPAAFADQPVTV